MEILKSSSGKWMPWKQRTWMLWDWTNTLQRSSSWSSLEFGYLNDMKGQSAIMDERNLKYQKMISSNLIWSIWSLIDIIDTHHSIPSKSPFDSQSLASRMVSKNRRWEMSAKIFWWGGELDEDDELSLGRISAIAGSLADFRRHLLLFWCWIIYFIQLELRLEIIRGGPGELPWSIYKELHRDMRLFRIWTLTFFSMEFKHLNFLIRRRC